MAGETGLFDSIFSGAKDLFADGGWLSNAFGGKNLSSTLKGIGSGLDAYAGYKGMKNDEKYKNSLLDLQKQQYADAKAYQEDELKRRDDLENTFASVWK